MARTIEISLAAEKSDELLAKLQQETGVVGINLHRGAALMPPGNVLTVTTTNEGLACVQRIHAGHDFSDRASVVTSEQAASSPPHTGSEPILRVPFGLLASEARAWSIGLKSTLAGYAVMMADQRQDEARLGEAS